MQKYFFANGNEQRGPYSLEELASFGLRPDTLVWHEGLTEWQRADAVPELVAQIQIGQRADAPGTEKAPGQQPGNPGYQPQLNYHSGLAAVPTDGFAIASLVLALVSFPLQCGYLIGMIPAILAIIFGFLARGRIRRGERTGTGMALAGLICGFISAGLVVVFIVIAFIVGMVAAMK
ncbi:MAG: DUF4339 domain-containing protein [Anaerolineae bacterium]|nr:DUF4339 domain-containing protein [Phycisphaerae bacterium]